MLIARISRCYLFKRRTINYILLIAAKHRKLEAVKVNRAGVVLTGIIEFEVVTLSSRELSNASWRSEVEITEGILHLSIITFVHSACPSARNFEVFSVGRVWKTVSSRYSCER